MQSLYAGIFNEEVCIQFLEVCEKQLMLSLSQLYRDCQAKLDPCAVFQECLDLVHLWGEPVFADHLHCLSKVADVDDLLRSTFITFVKMMYQRSGSPRLHVRLTVPPLSVYFRHLMIAAAQQPFIRSGAFFEPDRSPLDKKEAMMAIMRACLRECCAEYVIAQEAHEHAANQPTVPEPDVAPWESVSNVGRSTGSELEPPQLDSLRVAEPSETRSRSQRSAPEKGSVERASSVRARSTSSFNVKLSSELASTKQPE